MCPSRPSSSCWAAPRVAHRRGGAPTRTHLNLGATAFLRWNVFQRLSELGVAANDLTDAALNPVTHFKAQLGGDLADVPGPREPRIAALPEGPEIPRARRVVRRRREARRAAASRREGADEEGRPMTGAERLCRTLEALGVGHSSSDCRARRTSALFEALRTSRLRTVVATHELAASFMANGYARASGRPGVLATIPGPGLHLRADGSRRGLSRLDSPAPHPGTARRRAGPPLPAPGAGPARDRWSRSSSGCSKPEPIEAIEAASRRRVRALPVGRARPGGRARPPPGSKPTQVRRARVDAGAAAPPTPARRRISERRAGRGAPAVVSTSAREPSGPPRSCARSWNP